jgi:stringent starvation protein B
MTPSRPYLIRAFYDWITDNGLTPYLLVDATLEGVQVPQEYVEAGRIVLNVSPGAVDALNLGNDEIQFNARFGGSSRQLYFPPRAVLAIYARENGQGTMFSNDLPEEPEGGKTAAKPAAKRGKRPGLKVVK